jgi:hypothetical protein
MASPSTATRASKLVNSPQPEANVQHIKVTLTPTEVKAGFTTALDIIPALGAGKVAKVISASGQIATYGTAPYATNVTLLIKTATADDAQFSNAIILTSTVARHINFAPVASTGSTSKQLISNQPVQVSILTGNPTAGDSNVILHVAYTIIEE